MYNKCCRAQLQLTNIEEQFKHCDFAAQNGETTAYYICRLKPLYIYKDERGVPTKTLLYQGTTGCK